MQVISRKRLAAFWEKYRDAEEQLGAWLRVVKQAAWGQWADVQKNYPRASIFEFCLIFDICGGSYRLVARRSANWKTLFIIGIYIHKDYDLNAWKARCSDD